jgi:hypothetical protein
MYHQASPQQPTPVLTTNMNMSPVETMVFDEATKKRVIAVKRYSLICLLPCLIVFIVLCAVEIICMGFVVGYEYVDNKNSNTHKGFKQTPQWIALVFFSAITGAFYLFHLALILVAIVITPPGLQNFKPNENTIAGSESVITPTAAFMESSDSDCFLVRKYKRFMPTRTKMFYYFLFVAFLPLVVVSIIALVACFVAGGGGGGGGGNCDCCDCCDDDKPKPKPTENAPTPAEVV